MVPIHTEHYDLLCHSNKIIMETGDYDTKLIVFITIAYFLIILIVPGTNLEFFKF